MSTRNTKQKEEIEQLILKMSPLAKRYATKIHFMDYEKSFLQDKSDAEIAFELGISKQYVNRIKRQLFKPFLDQYK